MDIASKRVSRQTELSKMKFLRAVRDCIKLEHTRNDGVWQQLGVQAITYHNIVNERAKGLIQVVCSVSSMT